MAKLYFRYGTVGSAKTLNLLAVAHNYRAQSKQVLVVKPRLDDRFGEKLVKSRAGLEIQADILADSTTRFLDELIPGTQCVLVDEAQFLTKDLIDQLRLLADSHNIPVICYGLRTDFRQELFEGSRRLLEIADSIEEVKTTCAFCNKKAVFNLRFVNGNASRSGPSVDLGAEEKYRPVCSICYCAKVKTSNT